MRDFRVTEHGDNGEFLTWATVELLEDGEVVATEKFVCSSEDPPMDDSSAYWNGKDNAAMTHALSYGHAYVEVYTEADERNNEGPSPDEYESQAAGAGRVIDVCFRCGREKPVMFSPCKECAT